MANSKQQRIYINFIQLMYSSQEKIYLSGPEILNLIKKKPFTQIINGVEFTYSILSKIQKRFIMTNDRFLILKGIQSIGYVRSLEEKTQLPFKHEGDIPRTKLVYALSAVQSVITQNEVLKIKFTFDEKTQWEFVCPSKICALEWRKAIEQAIDKMRNHNNRKYQKYQDYTKQTVLKKAESSPQKELKQKPISPEKQIKNNLGEKPPSELNRNESLDSLMLGNQNQERMLAKSKSQLGVNVNEIVLVKVPDNSQKQIIDSGANFSKKNKEAITTNQSLNPVNNPSTNIQHYSFQPETYKSSTNSLLSTNKNFEQKYTSNNPPQHKLVRPEQLSKIQQVFLEKSLFEAPSQAFLSKSFSTMSINGRQQVRSQILSCRREWINELISREEQGELMIDFKRYSKKIVEVLINELHISNQKRIFPQKQWAADYASYIVDDVYVEIYFFSEEQIDQKHKRYQRAVKQFKNYDYFLEVTQNQENIFVPLMAIFEFKGFVGMVKSIVCNEMEPFRNQQLFNELNHTQLEFQSRISFQFLLNESKCKIVNYKKNNFRSKLVTQYQNIYFIDRLDTFLPEQKGSDFSKSNRLLRPELIQDELLQQYIFGQRQKDISGFQILSILDKKILSFVKHIQNQQQYFTNSEELTQIIHSFGLNARHLGNIYKKVTQKWLKLQLKAELAARSLKTLFRFDLQNCILNQIQRTNTKEKQSQREIRRVISFLNVVFGNGEATYRVWRGLNNYSSKHFSSIIWQDTFNDISIGYFLQAIQHHLKIVLDQSIHKKVYFQSNKTFEEKDFVRFQPDISIYNLDFTETFEEINECLEQVSNQNFHNLCRLMVKETKLKKTYIQILRGHPIYEKINEYLLNFISPEDNIDFYNKLETAHKPNRFVYESKLAEIRWHLKYNKLEGVNKIVDFIETHGRKWLGQNHPLFVQLNRILAEYYCDHRAYYMKAVTLATNTIEMQQSLLGIDAQPLWKDYFLLGKIYYTYGHHQNALPLLVKAKKLINIQIEPSLQLFAQLMTYLSKCYQQNKMNKQSYLNIKELYNVIKEEGNQFLLNYLLESVLMIKDLLEKNQQYESYYRFIETDFSNVLVFFANESEMLKNAIKVILFPYIKSVIFQKSRNRSKAINLLEEITKITQSSFSCISYLQQKIREKRFPHVFMQTMKDLDNTVDQIFENQLIGKWISFHRMSNETLLTKIGGSQISRGFEFLADLSAVVGVSGGEAHGQFSLMQK